MKVFICWSGETSMQIATQLRDWLSLINHNIHPFMSHEDIGKGIRWASKLAEELDDSNFGIICLTPENLSAPWLHFEGGALSKVAGSHVIPVLFQINRNDIQGPLAQFQLAVLDQKDQMRGVLESINNTMDPNEKSSVWERAFEVNWSTLEAGIQTLVSQARIQIVSPTSGGMLEGLGPATDGFRFIIRGTLNRLPRDHEIWLLNASDPKDRAKQWPQRVAQHDPVSGRWEGSIYLRDRSEKTYINAIVAPPTAQQLFEYYSQYGGGDKPLSHIPVECENKAQVWAYNPRYSRPT